MRRILLFGVLGTLAGFGGVGLLLHGAHAAPGGAEVVVNQLAGQYICQCGCGLTLASCNHPVCGPRDRMLAEIRHLVAEGKSPPEVTAVLVAQYGEAVLAAPPRRGFNLVAYWTPYAAMAGGAVAILMLAAAWSRRAPRRTGEPTTVLSADERRWLEEELRKIDA